MSDFENKTLIAWALVMTSKLGLLRLGSKYAVREDERVPLRGSTARAGVANPVAFPLFCVKLRYSRNTVTETENNILDFC